jgi:hypothetical protein
VGERISTRGVLEVVARAGETGIISGDIAASFSEGSVASRLSAGNQSLNRHYIRDHVERSATRESSRTGQHSWRWYITPRGRRFLKDANREKERA